MNPQRYDLIEALMHRRNTSTPDKRDKLRYDPQYNADLRRLTGLLATTDTAMDREGINLDTRDRILHALIYDHPAPPGPINWDHAEDRAQQRERIIGRVLDAASHIAIDRPPQAWSQQTDTPQDQQT